VPSIVTYPEGETPQQLRQQVRAAQEEAWPSDDAADAVSLAPVHDPALQLLSLILVDGDTVLSALDLLFKQIRYEGWSLAASGLSTVVTPLACRGRGFGQMLATHACRAMPGFGADLGLFTCDRPLKSFYEACGWETLPGAVPVGGTPEDPFPSDSPGMDKVTLGAFFSPEALEARTAFLDARIPLHSGLIDRLW
jgi:GNAT superfamily N-acetyltransferase